ncbi:SDR family NAD(P)-dependent oxidoreductase [Pengzhenrongella phosphoraccumulans]|uniref:SDR family NAD(P)-dependent oxidoreductase n=1 Tax=Pengzhenrongella phosphoraccumulans TaxID=3114394 RepID=UPI00388D1B44
MTIQQPRARTVIVTGAARGLGRAFALGFAAQGANVVVADIDEDGATKTALLVEDAGGCALAVRVDVTSPESTAALVAQAQRAFGPIHVLVNNAAIYSTLTRTPFTEIDPAEWDRVMAVNVKGTWLMTAAVVPALSASDARILNISSATVLSGSPLWMHYVASKAAVIGMTRVLARELGDRGVTVNTIAPGFTLTEASLGLMDDASTYGVDRGAIKRACQPEDIVGAALFLASPAASYVTGQTLVVDGGKQFL